MSDAKNDYGILFNKDIKLHRLYFKEMVKLLGVNCKYRAPIEDQSAINLHGDLNAKYYPEETVGCIFDQFPDQKTLKKQGWVAELQEGSSMIYVPYDLPHLAYGALFTIPSGIDNAEGRVFRVISMQNIMIYPATIACEIAPEYNSIDEVNNIEDFTSNNFNLLVDNEEDD